MLFFSGKSLADVCLYTRRTYPEECCGVLLGERIEPGGPSCGTERRIVRKAVPVKNAAAAASRRRHYRMDPMELVRIEMLAAERGLEILGFYHSHPDAAAKLSEEDKAFMMEGYSYLILSICAGCRGSKDHTGTVIRIRSYRKFRRNM